MPQELGCQTKHANVIRLLCSDTAISHEESYALVKSRIPNNPYDEQNVVTGVGFEPTPFLTTALTLRLRPLGHPVPQRWPKLKFYELTTANEMSNSSIY